MPIFIAALIGGLIQAAGSLVGSVLISLGIGYVAYQGLDTSLNWLRDQIAGSVSGLAAQSMAVLSALNAGAGISILISALAARLVVDGLTSGTLKKMVIK
jgi:hypothetical protein